jgi:tRNA-uridine 2-sulfurtransferase
MTNKKQKIVFVGMSGGVDSSVTAGILRDQGYNVVGVHLRCWNVDGCAEADAEDARRAAETLKIPFYVFDFEKEYRQKVVDYMVEGYRKGITPNPDVMCNHEIKFGMFFKRAMAMGADYVATGHYAKVKNGQLYAARDKEKDQSYFLWTLKPRQLKQCLFPLGDLIKKTDVRRLAKKFRLPNAEKKDSQGVCFLGQISLPDFLDNYIPTKKGKVVSTSGKVLGEHRGAQYFTIGQRRGIGVGGSAKPLYVAAKDIKKNLVILAPEDDESLYAREVKLVDVNIINRSSYPYSHEWVNRGIKVWVRVRYRQPLFPAVFKGKKLTFNTPQKFIAAGQSAVLYAKNGRVLGGGVISSSR